MKNSTKNRARKPITVVLFAAIIIVLAVTAVSVSAQESYDVCIWDADGGDCGYTGSDLCVAGFTYVPDTQTSPSFSGDETSIQSIEFRIYWTCGPGAWKFLVNGVEVGTGSSTITDCTCTPPAGQWPTTVTITNETVLNSAWNFGGTNTLGVHGTGSEATAWYEATVSYTTTLHAIAKPDTQTIDVGQTANFDASDSYDEVGTIVSYEWDFDDGTTGAGVTASHVYTTQGVYKVLLTVTNDTGMEGYDTVEVIVSGPPTVICVPWQDGTKPHPTWSEKEITLKGTVIDIDAETYEWDFGDGTGTEGGTVTDPYAIEASHAYTGEDGRLYTATLTVWDGAGASDSDAYYIVVKTQTFDVEKDVAIDEGLWYLHKEQNRYISDGIGYGTWGGSYRVACSGAAVHAFENQKHLSDGNPLDDPYVETVQRGLNYILSAAYTVDLEDEYDSNGNEIGIGCNDGSEVYEIGMAMMGIVASENKHYIAITGPEGVIGREYQDIIQDMVDYLSWAQNDDGGWRYSPNYGGSDNSVTQWPILGLEAAETQWDIEAPEFVKGGLDGWLEYSQNDNGGFGYTDPTDWVNIAKTGAGIAGLVYIGYDVEDERPAAAFNYIDEYWETDGEFWGYYYSLYSVMKACTIPLPPVETIGDHDWYAEIGQYLIDNQNANGNWPVGGWDHHTHLSTAWAIQILTKTVIVKMPVADANGPYESDEGFPVYFDGSGSYHQNPYRDIVLYEWDFESDGVFDFASTEPDDATHVYDTYGTYTVTLRVTDNSDPLLTDNDTAEVSIHEPPHPPTADANGPYEGWIGVPVTFDGSGSYDPNDNIVSWEWDLDGDGEYDDASGETVEYTWSAVYSGNIGLKVTDDTGLWDTHWTTVEIGNHPPVADANGPYEGYVEMPVTFDGSGSYDPDEACGDYIVSWEWDLDGDRQFDDASGEVVVYTWDEEYSEDIGLRVTDSSGETDVDWTTVVVIRPDEHPVCFTIDLKAGWNAISFPVDMTNPSVSNIFSGLPYYIVYSWDPVGHQYIKQTGDVHPGEGYWVFVVEDTSITVCGAPVCEYDVNLTAGWNMIGSIRIGTNILDPDDVPDNSVWDEAYAWLPGGYLYIETQNIDPCKGYWVLAFNDCTLTIEPAPPVPPSP